MGAAPRPLNVSLANQCSDYHVQIVLPALTSPARQVSNDLRVVKVECNQLKYSHKYAKCDESSVEHSARLLRGGEVAHTVEKVAQDL